MKNDYRKFVFTDNNIVITYKEERFSLTTSGKSFRKNADQVITEVVTPEFYQNYIQSIPFFANFGGKASCRAGHLSVICKVTREQKTCFLLPNNFTKTEINGGNNDEGIHDTGRTVLQSF